MINNLDGQPLFSRLKKYIPIVVAALVAAGFMSAVVFFSRAETVAIVSHSMASLAGFSAAGWRSKLMASAYNFGKWEGAESMRFLLTFTPWFLGFLGSGILLCKFQNRMLLALFYLAVLAATWHGSYEAYYASLRDIRDLRLIVPGSLIESATESGGRIFINSASVPAAAVCAPDILKSLPTAETLAELWKSPVAWRAEDRNRPFSAIVITGDPVESAKFLKSLPSDWHLAKTDNHGLLYLRNSGKTEIPTPDSGKSLFRNPRDRAIYLADCALVLESIERWEEACAMMSEAVKLAPDDIVVLVKSATLSAALKRWSQAKAVSQRALTLDPSNISARYLLALALLETGNANHAANELARMNPESNPGILLLQARIARQINDPATETAALEALLKITRKQKQSATGLYLFLGQAWARQGFSDQSLENYEAALRGDLTEAQRGEVLNAMSNIRRKTGKSGAP